MTTIFFSYSHKDEALRDQLETQLAMLRRQGLIEAWHDRRIVAGAALDHEISAHLEAADIILLLVSPDFLASDYCYDREMTRAMARNAEGTARVIPVILRHCDWHGAPFGKLMATPRDGKPITSWPDRDEAFLNVVQAIKAALPAPPRQPAPVTLVGTGSSAGRVPPAASIRSSNLHVARRFTEHDRSTFLDESFDFIKKYFEQSLDELQRRNADIQATFRVIDANRFTAVLFRGGRSAAQCAIFRNGSFGSKGIAYSNSTAGNAMNEQLSVDMDDQHLFLRPLLDPRRHGRSDGPTKFTMPGGAEHLWSMFIEPLQRR